MERELVLNGIYQHFKGKKYQVLHIAIDSETLKEVVVYKQLYDKKEIYVRDKIMFLSLVDVIKYPDVKQKYRFELVED